MKHQRQGIVWAPVLIMIGVVVVTGIAAYMLIQVGSSNQSENENTNVAVVNKANSKANENVNTNSSANTNQVANNNASVNTSTTTNTNTVSNANTTADPYAGWETLLNEPYDVEFRYPNTYFVSSNHYGVGDPAKAEAFFFRKTSTNYNGVPTLVVSANLTLSAGQTLKQLAESIYKSNKDKDYVTTDLTEVSYDGNQGYAFGLKTRYTDPNGYQALDSAGGRVVILQHGSKIFRFLQTGADATLERILNSIDFQ